jgi:glycosyltransferase involved in cell wall biosynthesis
MRALRIGVNALYLIPGGVGGTEIYLRSLLAAMADLDRRNRWLIFTNRETGPDLIPKQENFERVPQPLRAQWRPARILWEQTGLALETVRHCIDVLLNPGFTAPLACGCPQVTVFHDLQHKRHPEHFRRADLAAWRVLLYGSAQVSRLLIAVSRATADDLCRVYRLPERRIRVAPHGVDRTLLELAGRRRPVSPPFFLTVSTLHPHKNLDRLLEAFAEFRRERPGFRLVLAGMRGFFAEQLEALRDRLGLAEAVEFTGWIPRDDLYELYRTAHAAIYPSTFEGFGMPVLEALAAGVPLACSAIEPLREIAAGAALEFDPSGTAAIRQAMIRLADDGALRARLADAGPRRAAQFPWSAAAEATLAALREAARLG